MTEPEFDLPPKALPEVVAERDALADEVCRELARAGLPVHRGDLEDSTEKRPGARVHVTPFVDGGVYVNWTTDAALRDTALDLFARGIDYVDPPPLLRHYNSVLQHMRAALSEILSSAGFKVVEPDRHGHGSMIQVRGFRL